jgi:hypothetical protein
LFVDTSGYLNNSVLLLSILVDIATLAALVIVLWFLRRHRAATAEPTVAADDPQMYRLMVLVTAVFMGNGLIHIHLVGSQNSMHQLLVVAVLLVASWFFRWRELLLFFFLGNLCLAAIVALEWEGVLSYAPLFAQHETLTKIFLDWRTVLGQSINYILVLTICIAFVWRLRLELDAYEAQLSSVNEALRQEIAERVRSENEKAVLIDKLQASLDQVKTLHGLLPICMNCKKIRDDQGYWQKLENYLRQHAPEIRFAHGLCPDCIEELYPNDWESETDKESKPE